VGRAGRGHVLVDSSRVFSSGRQAVSSDKDLAAAGTVCGRKTVSLFLSGGIHYSRAAPRRRVRHTIRHSECRVRASSSIGPGPTLRHLQAVFRLDPAFGKVEINIQVVEPHRKFAEIFRRYLYFSFGNAGLLGWGDRESHSIESTHRVGWEKRGEQGQQQAASLEDPSFGGSRNQCFLLYCERSGFGFRGMTVCGSPSFA